MAFFARPQSRSAAVKIVAPPPTPAESLQDETGPPSRTKKDSIQRQCKNILIHGNCKFEGKGCMYYHPPRDDRTPNLSSSTAESTVGNENGPESATSNGTFSAQAVNAPIFVPRGSLASIQIDPSLSRVTSPVPPLGNDVEGNSYSYHTGNGTGGDSTTTSGMDTLSEHLDQMDFAEYMPDNDQQMMMQSMDPYFHGQHSFIRQPLDYHLYTAPIPLDRGKRYFVSDNIREELTKRSDTCHTAPMHGLPLPEEMQGYHSLVPLENVSGDRRKFASWTSTLYRATKADDGMLYCLRRIENFRLMQEAAFSTIEAWSRLRHPSIVSVREAFTTRAFGDNSLVVVYDYHPNSQTLFDSHLKPKSGPFHVGRLQHHHERIAEATLWSYIFQIGSAIKAVHEAGMAIRMIDASKILITEKNRVRISSCGVFDVLLYESRPDLFYMQQEDIVVFAKLVISLATGNSSAVQNVHKSLEIIGRHYSSDLIQVIHFLMKPPGPMKTIQGLFDSFANKLVQEMDTSLNTIDRLEGELQGELENGRLVRLLCKFGFINERPEFDHDPRWSETGDRYIIKLFRDHVFHSVDESGNPVVNLSHVLTNLNKLDAGTDERIMLVSRDEQSCLVVSYREIKSCVESAFSDLCKGSR